MKPLVSILIPAYNAERWIADTILSALAQSWPNKEIIIVDDGSTDGTLQVARQFASENVVVATHSNQGASATRNKAYALANGDFIQWLDADDLLSADKLQLQMECYQANPDDDILWSCAWGRFAHRPEAAKFVASELWQDLSPADWLVRKLEQNVFMQTATWLVSRKLTEAAGPWNPELWVDDDGEYFCRVLLASSGVRFVPSAQVFYRESGPNTLSFIGTSDRKLDAHFRSLNAHVSYLRSLKAGPRGDSACLLYLQRNAEYFYQRRPDLYARCETLAGTIGGALREPRLPLKYRWIQWAFGWCAAKAAQQRYSLLKQRLLHSWDKFRAQSSC
jgi:glycosyltransferase involved in cell wall biosynthesis